MDFILIESDIDNTTVRGKCAKFENKINVVCLQQWWIENLQKSTILSIFGQRLLHKTFKKRLISQSTIES